MALETLKGVKTIDNFNVVVMDELREKYPEKFNESGAMDYPWFEKEIRPTNFIYIRNDKNSIAFTLQNGPIKEVGVNGCQVDTLIQAAAMIIQGLEDKENGRYSCKENKKVIYYLGAALGELQARKKNR